MNAQVLSFKRYESNPAVEFSTWRCAACGLWDGYGRMGPGRYCFYSAYFKGKAAKPVPIAEAQKGCEKMGFAEIDWPSKAQGYE